MAGVSIRILLVDGVPDGLRIVHKSHWSGAALVCSRSRYLTARREREELGSPGIYVLAGQADDPRSEGRLYVGESEDVRRRVDAHAQDDFWTRAIVFTSKDGSLNKASIRYLEARLIQLARDAGRVDLKNSNLPGGSALSEADQVDAEAFLADMLMIFPLLGVRAFEAHEETSSALRLHLSGPDADALGAPTEEGFVVFSGGRARATPVDSMPTCANVQRLSLVESGVLRPVDGEDSFVLLNDHVFASPTAAAAVMLGRAAAGPVEWRDEEGKTLKELTGEQLAGD